MLNVLLTNDDGIEAEGLQAMRRALAELDGVRLCVIAPDGNRSAMARSITTRRPLWVAEVPFADGTVGYATDGTPVDCVGSRASAWSRTSAADLVVAGINHGANLGDDITYSGTVAAALEGVVLGLPAIAVSQQSGAGALDYRFDGGFGFDVAARVRGAPGGADRGRAAAGGHPAERQRPGGRALRGGGGEPRQADLPRRAQARDRGGGPPALLDLRRRPGLPRRARARISRPSRRGGSPSRRCTST